VKTGKTRIYLADASAGGAGNGAQVYRVDDASQPAATLTASSNAAWIRLSNPTDGNPGFAVYNYCNTPLVGSQCVYDMFVMSPPDNPDMVVVGGLMHYEELKPYLTQAPQFVGQRSNGRAVLMSTDAGATWTDVTGDVGGESMHPDQHALAFVPGNPSQFLVGSDGGVIRTSGQWADASSQCDSRSLRDALTLADCKAWLKQIPTKLDVLNAGLPTLQMGSISVNPDSPTNDALTGTQDNGTLAYSGSRTWYLPLTGDGGDSGFDAVDRATPPGARVMWMRPEYVAVLARRPAAAWFYADDEARLARAIESQAVDYVALSGIVKSDLDARQGDQAGVARALARFASPVVEIPNAVQGRPEFVLLKVDREAVRAYLASRA